MKRLDCTMLTTQERSGWLQTGGAAHAFNPVYGIDAPRLTA